ncbi:MAG: hypothetical protein MMC33_007777 [Icmadophila ericetorum]|nr:hypothetical protein [Icmadophila ericetorum]
MAPLPPQELPKRGDEWARSRTEVQFMKEGHVYFTDSAGPQRPDGPLFPLLDRRSLARALDLVLRGLLLIKVIVLQ